MCYPRQPFGFAMLASVILLITPSPAFTQEAFDAERDARYEKSLDWDQLHQRVLISLVYTADHTRLWYSVIESDTVGTYSLNLRSGQVEPLFDVPRLRSAVAHALGSDMPGRGTPFRQFSLADGSNERVRFSLERRNWTLDLSTYEVYPTDRLEGRVSGGARPQVAREGRFGRPDLVEVPSPDGIHIATLVEHDVAVRDVETDDLRQITSDGTRDHYWGYDGVNRGDWAWWSPDGRRLALRKVDHQGVDSFPLVRWLETPTQIEWIRSVHNVRSGQTLPREELHVWHRESNQLVQLDTGDRVDAYLRILGWRADGSELVVLRLTRDYQHLQLLASDPNTGRSRTILTQQFESCFSTPLWLNALRRYWPLSDGKRLIWKADHDGWDHLYLYDFDGGMVVGLTSGAWQVDNVVGIDEDSGWVYFSARTDPERPYDVHIHRVRLDGSGFARLTEKPGRYSAELTPGSDYLELWRRNVDAPTEMEIRSVDGTLVHAMATADVTRLRAAGWIPPEEFTVKAADGETDLWGVLYKPADFDPSTKYPVVEIIYGGPVTEYTPRTMPHWTFPHALAQLGYVVVILDARGTPGRGRAFLEAGFDRSSIVIADHAAALRHLGERHAYLDLERVGITGSSWGGNFTVRAMLQAPDLYRAGVAVSGGWWGNPELGDVKATVFEQCAVLKRDEHAAPSLDPLEGNLLVVHGTVDVNMSGSADLMWWLNSLTEAGKYVDLMILPERPHSLLHTNDRYVLRAIANYFAEHLQTAH
jgi:dipeptidyl aminopeptidase/acylaminoacyl peptidase